MPTERRVSLPPEILAQIIDLTPREVRPVCLLLSRMLHDLVVPLVFSSVTVEFGAWEYSYHDEADDDDEDEDDDVHFNSSGIPGLAKEGRSSRSIDILKHIMEDSNFARVVKKLEVRAYEPRENLRGSAFDLRCLMLATYHLCNLHSLVWYGECPTPSLEILESLGRTCPLLHEVALPCLALKGLPLRGLRALRSIIDSGTHLIKTPVDDLDVAEDSSIYLHGESLRKASLPATWITRIPPRLLPNLTHVELLYLDLESVERLGPFLKGLAQLQSLTISLDEVIADAVLTVLASSRDRNPRLTELCLQDMLVSWADGGYSYSLERRLLSKILLGRHALRRFRLNMYACPEARLIPYLAILATLKNLEVLELALIAPRGVLTCDFMSTLACHLPNGLTGLVVNVCADVFEPDALDLIWSKLPRLGYLHLRTPADLPSIRDLIARARNLKVLGHNGRLYGVDYRAGSPELTAWPRSMILFRRAELYGFPEWEWLTRHTQMYS
ncbi:uncharacterized protein B0H18DRAFT_1007946 [Fomitopsis serialis]|uniref:uncharacterized protein n=1 Tax=Fomitopsis serialis TaxID=139415 RepID=UPI002007ED8E|nr:uncharacterized protein B0H18DRAFT_1007946 [Neoantrodia serialis]KAH9925734.1 hypothetical protein B0H18DRAFT_1007946 [Neoantrodia serialis]